MVKCSFCENERNEKDIIIANNSNSAVCKYCIKASSEHFSSISEVHHDISDKINTSPSLMKEYLDKYVVGQDNAKKTLCTMIYYHMLRVQGELTVKKSNLLMLGPSGSGKTYMIQCLFKKLNIPYVISDAASLTATGFWGNNISDLIRDLYINANMSVKDTENGVVVLDEFDKIASGASHYGTSVQQELLKLIEEKTVDVSSIESRYSKRFGETMVNTKNITFIFLGAFSRIYSSLTDRKNFLFDVTNTFADKTPKVTMKNILDYGFINEIVGRIGNIATLSPLTHEQAKEILMQTEKPIIGDFVSYFQRYGIELTCTDKGIDRIIVNSNFTDFGARALTSTLTNILTEYMFLISELKTQNVKKIQIDEKNDVAVAEIIYQ